MIVCVELQFDGENHEDCNSGIIRLLCESSGEEIYVVAGSLHIAALKKVGIPERVNFVPEDIPPWRYAEQEDKEEIYHALLIKMVNELHITSHDKLFILSSPKAITTAVLKIVNFYRISCFFIEHANLDGMLREQFEDHLQYSYKNIINKIGESEYAKILTYSPYAKDKVKGTLSDNTRHKMYFINHPVDDCREKDKESYGNRTIGVYGACVNEIFREMLKKMDLNKGYDFLVLRRASIDRLDYKYIFPDGIEMHQRTGMFSYEERLEYIKRMGWILMPYDQTMYRVSMSGILADAIRYERPIIALNSPIIEWYNKQGPIGIVAENIEELVNKLEPGFLNTKYIHFINNIKTLKDNMMKENRKLMREILSLR